MAMCVRWGCVGILGVPGGGGAWGPLADGRDMRCAPAGALWAHCGEEFGCLLVPQLACRKYGYKHGMEGLCERKDRLFHLPVNRWLDFR